MSNKKDCKWFKETKKESKKEDIKPMKIARDSLVLAGSMFVIGAGLKYLKGGLD